MALQAKMTSFILSDRSVFFILTRLVSSGWTDFYQVLTKRHLCGVIPQSWCPM